MALTLTNKIALSILARVGTAGIRHLQAAAALAHRTGYPDAADAILEIADAAEDALADGRFNRPLGRCRIN